MMPAAYRAVHLTHLLLMASQLADPVSIAVAEGRGIQAGHAQILEHRDAAVSGGTDMSVAS